jgi:hypothetical protein
MSLRIFFLDWFGENFIQQNMQLFKANVQKLRT